MHPALWNEARRQCVFDGEQPRCQDGQEASMMACSQHASAVGFLEEPDELDHALETWSDTPAQYWVSVGRNSQTPRDWKVCDLSYEACFRRNPHATGLRHFGRWRKCGSEIMESFLSVGQSTSSAKCLQNQTFLNTHSAQQGKWSPSYRAPQH